MLTEDIKNPKTNISIKKLEHLNDYMIKIDYFDQKGTKSLENNIPLTCILNPVLELPQSNTDPIISNSQSSTCSKIL